MQPVRELFNAINDLLSSGKVIVVAIDGRCGAGKTTLAHLIKDEYDCSVISMDHFFLRPEQRTAARFLEAGGNVDYERFRAEVTDKIKAGQAFSYQVYDCHRQSLTEEVQIEPNQLVIIEGSYSHHPHLGIDPDLRVLLTIDPAEQRRRILQRNGPEMYKRFVEEWIPLEERYFAEFRIPEISDFVFELS